MIVPFFTHQSIAEKQEEKRLKEIERQNAKKKASFAKARQKRKRKQ